VAGVVRDLFIYLSGNTTVLSVDLSKMMGFVYWLLAALTLLCLSVTAENKKGSFALGLSKMSPTAGFLIQHGKTSPRPTSEVYFFGSGESTQKKGSGSSDGDMKGKKGCKICMGEGFTNCAVCKGTGIDKKGGSILERWTCKTCKGFGYINCSNCNPVGLTPEQRGER